MIRKPQVWSVGGGRQSCGLGALIIQGKFEKPDIAVMADTGREKKRTWDYLNAYLIPGLASVGVTLEIIKSKEWGYAGESYVDGSGDLMLPVYTADGKNSPDCSGSWKRDAINRWLSVEKGITRSQYVKWIGFSRDEPRRILRMRKSKKEGGGKSRFPLLELWLTKRECIQACLDIGWPEPPWSACWMCPNMNDDDWRNLTPEELVEAVAFENEMRRDYPDAFLHRSLVPLSQIDFSTKPQADLFNEPCDSGLCFT